MQRADLGAVVAAHATQLEDLKVGERVEVVVLRRKVEEEDQLVEDEGPVRRATALEEGARSAVRVDVDSCLECALCGLDPGLCDEGEVAQGRRSQADGRGPALDGEVDDAGEELWRELGDRWTGHLRPVVRVVVVEEVVEVEAGRGDERRGEGGSGGPGCTSSVLEVVCQTAGQPRS